MSTDVKPQWQQRPSLDVLLRTITDVLDENERVMGEITLLTDDGESG